MKKRVSDKFWFPFWVDKWIFGSMRIECSLEERAIWVDLLALASKDDGFIRANEETPYPTQQLAGWLIVPEETLKGAIDKFVKMEKLQRSKNGTLYVTKWEKYQFTDRWKRKLKEESSEKTEQPSSESEPIIKNNITNNNKENNINILCEEEHSKLWKAWPKEGRFDSKETLKKLKAIQKQGKLELFKKVSNGYLQFLQHQKDHENFPQKAKHLKTWMNNWEGERESYEDFKYEPRL